MKKFYALFLGLILWSTSGFAQCDNIYLSTQADVDNFPVNHGCTSVTGYLYIAGSDITNLNGLSGIHAIQELHISNATNLTNYSGLNNLTTVTGDLNIDNSTSSTIAAFSHLTAVGGILRIASNPNLTQLPAFSNLTTIGGLQIDYNNSLQNLNGFTALSSINGSIEIYNNSALNSISGVNNINSNTITTINIGYNSQLATCNIPSLCSYLSHGGNCSIYSNAGGCNSSTEVIAACNPGCQSGDLNFTSQAQIDAFKVSYPTCTLINGSLYIQGADITNLNGLSNIISVLGNVSINYNNQLTSLTGLNNLKTINGSLYISYNDLLANPNGLNALTKISGVLYVTNNPNLVNLNGLNALTSVTTNYVYISNNNALTSLSGLNNLATVSGLYVVANPLLTALTGLQSLPASMDEINIYDNYALTSLTGLSNLTSVSNLQISGNSALTSLTGLNNISSVHYLSLNSNNALQNLNGLGNLTTTSAQSSYNGGIQISNNTGLTSLNGLNALTTVQDLSITNNALLNNLTALAGITSLSTLNVSQNPSLTSLTGLNNFNPTTLYNLILQSNPTLVTCNVPSVCSYLSNGSTATISGNAPGCNSSVDVQMVCNNGSQCPAGNLIFSSQSQIDAFGIHYPTCTVINGSVTITGSDITNLNGLSHITTINQALIIQSNPLLTNVSGLNNVTFVGGYGLTIDSNATLTSIAALQNLTNIGTDYWGYGGNYYFYTGINITNNAALTSLNGLQNVATLGFLNVSNNSSLTSLTTMSCTTLGEVTIATNPMLTTLNGLGAITSIGDLSISNNATLTSLQGLHNVASLDSHGSYYYYYQRLDINQNGSLTSLAGLENINPSTINYLSIYNNPNLTYCNTSNVCSYLTANYGNGTVEGNATGCNSVNEVRLACGNNSAPTFGTISPTEVTICNGNYQTFYVTGLVPRSISRIRYSFNGGATTTIDNIYSDASGNSNFSINFNSGNNGQTLSITAIERTDVATGTLVVSSNNAVLLHIPEAATTYYYDGDNDGYGVYYDGWYSDGYHGPTSSCTGAPTGYVSNNSDCNDNDPLVYQYSSILYIDADGDGYDAGQGSVCYGATLPVGYSQTTSGSDCNDNDATMHTSYPFYADSDGDGYGAGNLVQACAVNATTVPTGYSANNTDCAPNYASANAIHSFYSDTDGDGYGSGNLIPVCSLNETTPPAGYSLNNTDCFPNDPSIYTSYTFYADVDGDGFGAGSLVSTCAANAALAPAGYSVNNTDCSPNNALEFPGQTWYIDADGDGYGTGNYIIQCLRPLHGYSQSELRSINGDCNDNNPNISPTSQRLEFSGATNFTTALCSPLNGTLYTNFTFEVTYFDANNALPPASFPRVYLDYEGNGSFNDSKDRAVIMTPADVNDLNTVDGKKYIGTINGLDYGTNYQTRIQVGYGSCLAEIGPFDYPKVQEAPNLQIFANDITFSTNHPAVSSPLTVNTVVHNESDFPAVNFYAHLVNQFDTTIVYGDVLVPYLAPHSTATVSWNITTPSVPAWCPMQVKIDYTNTIAESNELDNSAIRPFINGNYNLLGGIEIVNTTVSPSISYIPTSQDYITISGKGLYFGTPTPLLDPSVAGATVTYTIVETGATFSTYTNSQGEFSDSFPAPMAPGIYHIQGELSDYTFIGNFSLTFTRLFYCATDLTTNVNVITNTALVVDGGVPSNTIIAGESVSGSITVNNGCQPVNVSTLLGVNQTGGTPVINSVTVPPLMSNGTYTTTFNNIVFNTPGTYMICGTADANNSINEEWENNTQCQQITVLPNLPDIQPQYFEVDGHGLRCNTNNIYFTLANTGGAASGSFNCDIIVRKEGTIIDTLHETVSNINALSSYYFTKPITFSAIGDYSFELQCDVPLPNGAVTEYNELNNTAIYNLHLEECVYKPELSFVSCESFNVRPVDPQNPGMVTYVATLVNNGNATATGPIGVRFHLSGGQNYDTQYSGDLVVGQSAEITVNAPSVPSGTQTLTAIADYNNLIDEYSEDNNSITGSLCWDFEPLDRPEYCKGPLDDFWNYTQIVNKPVYMSVGVNQYGLYDASTVLVKFEISGPGLTGTVNLGNATLQNVAQNCNCPYNAALPYSFIFPQEGDYIVTMTVDPNNVYTECNEGNNVLVRTVHVSNFPDLRVVSQFINPSLLNPDPGTPVTLNVTYENIGTTDLQDTNIELQVLVDEVPFSTVHVGGLGTGENNTVTIPVQWSSNVVGAHIIRTVIDSNHQIVEGNEMNNEATRAIVVGEAANLHFNLFAVNNPSPALGSQIMINATIANQGSLSCEGDVMFYYLNDQQIEVQIGMIHVSVNNNSTTSIQLPWTVLDASTKIIAKIINASVLEFTYDDNEASTTIGGMSLSITSTQSHTGLSDGTLTALITGGQAPYSYSWSNGFNNQILTAAAGTYSITVTDATGQNIAGTGTITVNQNTQIFCSGAKVSNLVASGTSIKWYSVATGGTVLTATTVLKTMTYYYTQTVGGITSPRIPVIVVVKPIAKAGKIVATINNVITKTVCLGGSLTFTSSTYVGDAIAWQYTTDAPISATNSTPQTWSDILGETGLSYTKTNVTNAPGTKFYIRAKYSSGTCTTAYSTSTIITVDPTSVGGTVTGGGVICSGTGGTLKLTLNVGKTIQWWSSTNGTDYTAIPLATNATLTVTGLLVNTWYKAQVTSGACSSDFSNAVKFEIGREATVGTVTADATSICKGTSTTLHLSTGNFGTLLWEKSTNGTTWSSATSTTTSLTTPLLTVSTYFRATTYIGTSATVNCLVAHSQPVLVSVIAAPVSKGITGNVILGTNNGSTMVKALACNDTNKVLSVTNGSIGSIQWQWSTTSTLLGFNDISGAINNSYTISSPSRATGANYYKVKFTNTCGVSVYSNVITVYYAGCPTGAGKEISNDEAVPTFDVVAYPNPFGQNFNLNLTTSNETKVDILVYDMLGKLLEQREVNPVEVSDLKIGELYPTGIYNIIVTQGTEVKTLRIIKR